MEPRLLNQNQACVVPLFIILLLQTKLSHCYEAKDVTKTDELREHTSTVRILKYTFVISEASISKSPVSTSLTQMSDGLCPTKEMSHIYDTTIAVSINAYHPFLAQINLK